MAAYEDYVELPPEFDGTVRLFPLPNLVMFPHVMLPLHVFEPRYRDLLEDALATDKLITMTLLEPGWEMNYEGRPAVFPEVCIGRIVNHVKLANGTYNVLLVGLKRARIVRELRRKTAFRQAEVMVTHDLYSPETTSLRSRLQKQLLSCFRKQILKSSPVQEHLEQLLTHKLPLGVLADIVAYTAPLPTAVKQSLLAELNVDDRAATVLRHLQREEEMEEYDAASDLIFPPPFSLN